MAEGQSKDRCVIVGQFAGAHGVRGAFKVRSFTDDPVDVAAYGPLRTPDGLVLTLALVREAKPSVFVATAPEIDSPEACAPYKGAVLTVPRAALPPPEDEDEFYLSDLEGMAAITPDGAPAGRVRAVVNFGAGDLLELDGVPGRKGSIFLAFTREVVPVVSLAEDRVTVVLPPEETADQAERESPDEGSEDAAS